MRILSHLPYFLIVSKFSFRGHNFLQELRVLLISILSTSELVELKNWIALGCGFALFRDAEMRW